MVAKPLPRALRPGCFRRALFQVHLWAGIGLSIYVVVISSTGSAIVFRRELDKTLCPSVVSVPIRGRRLTAAELKARAQAAYPRFAAGQIEVRAARAPDAPQEIDFAGGGVRLERLFDPYTGANLGDPIGCEPRFVSALADFHDNLLSGRTGLRVNGSGALAVTLLALSGVILWWPGVARWWRGFTVRMSVPWYRTLRDLHGVLGIVLALFVLLWAVTGIYFAFPAPFNALTDAITDAGAPALEVDDAVAWVVRLHFGRAFGRGVEVLWAAVGVLATVLVATGVIIWWHRQAVKGRVRDR